MKIAIYDTSQVFAKQLADYLSSLHSLSHLGASIKIFISEDDLFLFLLSNKLDILFYNLTDSNILNFSNIIQKIKNQKKLKLVFMSYEEELVFDSLKYHPYGFVRKKKYVDDVEEIVSRFINNDKTETHILKIKSYEVAVYLNISDIYYIEKEKGTNYVLIYTNNTSYRYRSSISQLEKILDSTIFLSAGQHLIINLNYILHITNCSVAFDNGMEVNISPKLLPTIKKIYYHTKNRPINK